MDDEWFRSACRREDCGGRCLVDSTVGQVADGEAILLLNPLCHTCLNTCGTVGKKREIIQSLPQSKWFVWLSMFATEQGGLCTTTVPIETEQEVTHRSETETMSSRDTNLDVPLPNMPRLNNENRND